MPVMNKYTEFFCFVCNYRFIENVRKGVEQTACPNCGNLACNDEEGE